MKKYDLIKRNPQELSLEIIKILPLRTQDIIKKRFGLENNEPKTLEAVGQDYKITRERVRQIVKAALEDIKKDAVLNMADVFMKQAEQILKQSKGVEESEEFFQKINKSLNERTKNNFSAIKFLLGLNPNFVFEYENELHHSFWHFSEISKDEIYKKIKEIEKYLSIKKKPSKLEDILLGIKKNIFSDIGEEELSAYLRISQKIGMNPFGEYGLYKWNEIEPSGAKDRAYLIVKHSKKPLHFSDIANLVNKYDGATIPLSVSSRSWNKKICIQTVHNELIRDPRFVLIGRGIYALKEWGYKPGKIVDIIKEILQEAGKPLKEETIIQEVKKRRISKETTIILNLHNKKYFEKLPNKYYTLIKNKPYKILEV